MFAKFSITSILNKYLTKEISPLDVAQECILKYKKYNNFYKPLVTFNEESIIKQASKSSNLIAKSNLIRPLEAIPIGIKDIFNTIDFPTQMGSEIWKNFMPGNDARCVDSLKRSGGIIGGKTVTAEFAVHSLNETLNPYDTKLTPGTSSSGSAVSVLLGIFPVTIGTQTAGSIIRPASFCGVYGFKPSFGIIPRTGMLKTTDSLDTIGFFVSHQKNMRIVLDAIRVHGINYPYSFNAFTNKKRQEKRKLDRWKVGFVKTHTWKFADHEIKSNLEKFISEISNNGAIDLKETDLPPEISESHRLHEIIYNKSLSYYFKEEYKQKEFVSIEMNKLIENGNLINPKDYQEALVFQAKLQETMDIFMQDFDVLISLSTTTTAPPRGEKERPDPSLIWTFLHLPSINIPKFYSSKKLPFGIQFISRKYNDYLLLNFVDFMVDQDLIPKISNIMP